MSCILFWGIVCDTWQWEHGSSGKRCIWTWLWIENSTDIQMHLTLLSLEREKEKDKLIHIILFWCTSSLYVIKSTLCTSWSFIYLVSFKTYFLIFTSRLHISAIYLFNTSCKKLYINWFSWLIGQDIFPLSPQTLLCWNFPSTPSLRMPVHPFKPQQYCYWVTAWLFKLLPLFLFEIAGDINADCGKTKGTHKQR